MSIITNPLSLRWGITLNRPITTTLTPTGILIANAPASVRSVVGSGNYWQITLINRSYGLEPNPHHIRIDEPPGFFVEGTTNLHRKDMLQEIRNLLSLKLDESDISDDTILSDVFVGKAEDFVLEQTATDDYVTFITTAINTNQFSKVKRFEIAAMYRTAALLIPTLPDILREQFRSESRQYVEIDWQEKINLFIAAANEAIVEDIVKDISADPVIGSSYCVPVTY